MVFSDTTNEEGNFRPFKFDNKNIDFKLGQGGYRFVVSVFNKILYYEKIDVNKIKFEGTCDLKDKKVKK